MTTANESPQGDGIVRLANIAAQAAEVIGEHIKNHEDYETHGGRIADLALAELKPLIEREVSQAIIHAIAQAIEEIQKRTDEAVIQARDQMEKDTEPLRREMQESREENRKAASALLQAYQGHTLAAEETSRKSTSVLLQAYQNATENSERLQRSAAEFWRKKPRPAAKKGPSNRKWSRAWWRRASGKRSTKPGLRQLRFSNRPKPATGKPRRRPRKTRRAPPGGRKNGRVTT